MNDQKIAENRHWVTSTGALLAFDVMADQHIRNALAMSRRDPERTCWIAPLEAELARRGGKVTVAHRDMFSWWRTTPPWECAQTPTLDAGQQLADAIRRAADAEGENAAMREDMGAQLRTARARADAAGDQLALRDARLQQLRDKLAAGRRITTELWERLAAEKKRADDIGAENAELRELLADSDRIARTMQPITIDTDWRAGDLALGDGDMLVVDFVPPRLRYAGKPACSDAPGWVRVRREDATHAPRSVLVSLLDRPPLVVGGWVRHVEAASHVHLQTSGRVESVRDGHAWVLLVDGFTRYREELAKLIPIASSTGGAS